MGSSRRRLPRRSTRRWPPPDRAPNDSSGRVCRSFGRTDPPAPIRSAPSAWARRRRPAAPPQRPAGRLGPDVAGLDGAGFAGIRREVCVEQTPGEIEGRQWRGHIRRCRTRSTASPGLAGITSFIDRTATRAGPRTRSGPGEPMRPTIEARHGRSQTARCEEVMPSTLTYPSVYIEEIPSARWSEHRHGDVRPQASSAMPSGTTSISPPSS